MSSHGLTAANLWSRLLRTMLYLANQFSTIGFAVNWGLLYSYEIRLFPTDSVSPRGTLRDGRPYELTCIDIATPEEKANGIAHYRIGCVSEGKELGHLRIWLGDKYIGEFERVVHFNGWYALDAYSEPEARGLLVNRMCTLYGMRVAKESSLGGKYYCGFTHAYNRAAIRAFETMGFKRGPNILFVKIFGKRWWKGVSNGVTS